MASEKVTAIVEELKVLTVLELSELVKAVEEEFGVSAAAAVAVAAPAAGGAAAERDYQHGYGKGHCKGRIKQGEREGSLQNLPRENTGTASGHETDSGGIFF